MPPIRSLSSSKPMKTERTHEENQERFVVVLGYVKDISLTTCRAYIAASRRSDRSLEARIESARRASEIHKRRTGRSLRVTEQDVVNEEMYEEEDNDLPMQYRRLTAHLDTNSADFNRRLSAYLTNHVAMRSALNQAISNAYPQQQQQQQQGGPQWSPNAQTPQDAQASWPQPPPQYSNGMVPPQMLHRTTHSHHHQPYPGAASRQSQSDSKPTTTSNVRRPSTQDSQRRPSQGSVSNETRRPSMTAPSFQARQSAQRQASSRSSSFSNTEVPSSRPANDRSSTTPLLSRGNNAHQPQQSPPPNFGGYPSYDQSWGCSQSFNISPLTTAMPPETQMFFGGGNGFNTSYDMPPFGNSKVQPPMFDPYSDNVYPYPFMNGMSQTLAPSTMDKAQEQMNWASPTSASADSGYYSTTGFPYGTDGMDNDAYSKMSMPEQGHASGQLTPADHDWASLINTSSWSDNET